MSSDMLQTPGFFTSAMSEGENPFEISFKSGNATLERAKEHKQSNEANEQRDINSYFLRAQTRDASNTPLYSFSPRPSPGSPFADQRPSLGGMDVATQFAWNGSKLDNPPNRHKVRMLSPPTSAVQEPENWPYYDFPQQPVRSPLHYLLTQSPTNTRTQYGQPTPPDDHTPSTFGYVSQPQQAPSPAVVRNTAAGKRKRHSKDPSKPSAKRGRKAAAYSKNKNFDLSSTDTNNLDDAKRSKFLERNRVAASKCRQKKKEWTSNLETRARELQNNKKQLAMMVDSLREEMLSVKGELLKHTGCGCKQIRDYLSQEVNAMTYPRALESAASPIGTAPSSRHGSMSDGSDHDHEESRSKRKASKTSPLTQDDPSPPSPTVHFKSETHLEALLNSELANDTSDQRFAARIGQ